MNVADLPERIERKIRIVDSGCWEWTASLRPEGYGQVRDRKRMARAHRLVYELLVGPIPEGLPLDHLCRNRRCVNPTHLEPVTVLENLRRGVGVVSNINATKTHCLRGHEFNADNTYTHVSDKRAPHRICRPCANERRRVARAAS